MMDYALTPKTYDLQFIPRWAIVRTIKQQTVAEHSFFVMLYAMRIAEIVKHQLTPLAMECILTHDLDELESGDIPTPFKEDNDIKKGKFANAIHYCSPEAQGILRIADKLESLVFLITEENMGNNSVRRLMALIEKQLYDCCCGYFPDHHDLYNKLHEECIKPHKMYLGRTS